MTQQLGTASQGNQTTRQPAMQSGGTLPQQTRAALHEVAQAVQVCGWCADQCIQSADPNMIECVRRCEDVVELGEALLAIAPRSSRYTAQIAQAFQQAAQECARECGHHQMSHCQDCASTLPQAASAARQLTQGQMSGQQIGGQQTGGQQMRGQQMGGTGGARQTW